MAHHITLTAYARDGKALFLAKSSDDAETKVLWASIQGRTDIRAIAAHNTKTGEVYTRKIHETAPEFGC